MTAPEPEDTNDEPSKIPINPAQVAKLIHHLREIAQVVYYRPPNDVDCAVTYEDGSSYYRVNIRWKATPTASADTGSITDVDSFLRNLFNEEERGT